MPERRGDAVALDRLDGQGPAATTLSPPERSRSLPCSGATAQQLGRQTKQNPRCAQRRRRTRNRAPAPFVRRRLRTQATHPVAAAHVGRDAVIDRGALLAAEADARIAAVRRALDAVAVGRDLDVTVALRLDGDADAAVAAVI